MNQEPSWRVEYYEDERGRAPVATFIESLEHKMRLKVGRSIRLLRAYGLNLSMPHARPVTGEPFRELRVQMGGNIVRIFYFATFGRRLVLLHGFVKKDQRTPRREIEVARQRHADLLRRLR